MLLRKRIFVDYSAKQLILQGFMIQILGSWVARSTLARLVCPDVPNGFD
jgi:hypothetical protein